VHLDVGAPLVRRTLRCYPRLQCGWAERIAEGNEPDQQARASFAKESLQGLYCLCRWMRVTCRHDGIRERPVDRAAAHPRRTRTVCRPSVATTTAVAPPLYQRHDAGDVEAEPHDLAEAPVGHPIVRRRH
jgi:hypothetical protein